MMNFSKRYNRVFSSFIFALVCFLVLAGEALSAGDTSSVQIFLSPRSGSFGAGSTFEVPIFINTNANKINAINIKINFDKNKLAVVEPSGGKSIISSWTESPSYDNTKGLATYVGSIPEGLVTDSGLVATITFKALATGSALVSISPSTKVTLDDGLSSSASLDLGRAEYSILKKVSDGIQIFSETNPSEEKWSTNNNPVLSWQRDMGVTGFSFELDNKPNTIPDNVVDGVETTKSFENLTDGLWYFHLKAQKLGAWGTTGHFTIKIDTIPPAPFKPAVNNFSASAILVNRSLVSFFTTDNLSGIDHYEVGTIDESQPITLAPVFIETGSPFQVPVVENSAVKVIVRAIDKAGNIREGFVEVAPVLGFWKFFKNNFYTILITLMFLVLLVYALRSGKLRLAEEPSEFKVLENDVEGYLAHRKETNERNLIEKEKITELEQDLEKVKVEIEKEINEAKHDAPLNQ